MNENDPAPGRKALHDFLGKPKVNSHGQEPLEAIAGDDSTDASDGCGRSSTRGLFQGFILEMENGDREGIFYGAVLGRFRLNPSVGVSFVFEAEDGMHRVTITGNNLFNLHRELLLGRRESVRISENGGGVTGIEVEAWSRPGKKMSA